MSLFYVYTEMGKICWLEQFLLTYLSFRKEEKAIFGFSRRTRLLFSSACLIVSIFIKTVYGTDWEILGKPKRGSLWIKLIPYVQVIKASVWRTRVYLFSFCISIFNPFDCHTVVVFIEWCHHGLMDSAYKTSYNHITTFQYSWQLLQPLSYGKLCQNPNG